MKYPIIAYGNPVLRIKASEIDRQVCPEIGPLINDMFETLKASHGVGLAAPQIGKSIRLFVVDLSIAAPQMPEFADFKKVFINPLILEESGEEWAFNEGCLSIPGVTGEVYRKPKIKIAYFDENWRSHEESFEGVVARVLQHEYDHLEGKLFIDTPELMGSSAVQVQLDKISDGTVEVPYEMKFATDKKADT